MCLEMMKGQSYNEKVDVWSFGMVLYELTTNTIPYHHCQNQVQIIAKVCKKKKTPPLPKNTAQIHPILLGLMKKCWNWKPRKRPSFTQIVQILREQMKSCNPLALSHKPPSKNTQKLGVAKRLRTIPQQSRMVSN
jgi:serine/threonine protein kinase